MKQIILAASLTLSLSAFALSAATYLRISRPASAPVPVAAAGGTYLTPAERQVVSYLGARVQHEWDMQRAMEQTYGDPHDGQPHSRGWAGNERGYGIMGDSIRMGAFR